MMTKVFIGGSRRISRLDAEVKRRIDRMIEKRLPVIVGDANGADKAVQDYLRTKDYDLVEVFCSGDSCRNNRGGWPTRTVPVPSGGKRKDFSTTCRPPSPARRPRRPPSASCSGTARASAR